ncbi:MAG: hypothetical protein IKU67_00480 [Firmicutes bacterium]|nr:hypothetical protein [Bacillota bacterium]
MKKFWILDKLVPPPAEDDNSNNNNNNNIIDDGNKDDDIIIDDGKVEEDENLDDTLSDTEESKPQTPQKPAVDDTKESLPENGVSVPNTGDNSNITIYVLVMMASLVGVIKKSKGAL